MDIDIKRGQTRETIRSEQKMSYKIFLEMHSIFMYHAEKKNSISLFSIITLNSTSSILKGCLSTCYAALNGTMPQRGQSGFPRFRDRNSASAARSDTEKMMSVCRG